MKKIKIMTLIFALAFVAMFASFLTSQQAYANDVDESNPTVESKEIDGITYNVVYSYSNILNEFYQDYLEIYSNLEANSSYLCIWILT